MGWVSVFIAILVWSCGMLSDAVVENLVHTVNDKTVRSGAWLIFVKAVFANYFINVSVIVMQLATFGKNCGIDDGGDHFSSWVLSMLSPIPPICHGLARTP